MNIMEVVGFIERITFHNEENGFTVAKLKEPRKKDLTCLVGTLHAIQVGETVRCKGNWKHHPVHGSQFEVESFERKAPTDLIGIQKYLESGLIKGIGPAYAKRIVEKFGVNTLEVIDSQPEKLSTVDGLGSKRIDKIVQCFKEQKEIRELMIFLQEHEISPTFAYKLFKIWGQNSITKLLENPYRLASEVRGIGFKTADKIAQKLGIPKESHERLKALFLYLLQELSSVGHTAYPQTLLLEHAKEMSEVDLSLLSAALNELEKEAKVIPTQKEDTLFISLPYLLISEKGIARHLKRLQSSPTVLRSVDAEKASSWAEKEMNLTLAEQQKEAVKDALSEKVLIITGGPGTGKSTITKAILKIHSALTKNIILAAPTGRAAKRMNEITGYRASTIHSLLEYDFSQGGFKRKEDNPLECDLLIVDEASMIDTPLMYALLRATPSKARLLIIGDVHQLPSVGPGSVLKELIDSQAVKTATLTQIFRQAAGSKIITNAHLILNGEYPDLRKEINSDFFFIGEEDPHKLSQLLVDLVKNRLPKKYRYDPFDAIQVLSPMKKGAVGIENLNFLLQDALNMKSESLFKGSLRLRIGDKVIQTRNDYQKEVYNGDIGRVVAIDMEEQCIVVKFDGHEVEYEFNELDALQLAYAISVHKFQGSECPCVVIPVHTTHFKLLERNLLYTAVTRGKKLVVLLGSKRAIGIAVNTQNANIRHTLLKHFIALNL